MTAKAFRDAPSESPLCHTSADGTKTWLLQHRRHRENGPAVERPDGTKEWYRQGMLHREDGPAVEYADGSREWFLDGERHRADGPAIERADGTKSWCLNGYGHRTDGPAVIRVDGSTEWWFEGRQYDEATVREKGRQRLAAALTVQGPVTIKPPRLSIPNQKGRKAS